MKQFFISIIVPVYNEETNIPMLYSVLERELSDMGCDYEIILVDDGSTDHSVHELRKLERYTNKVRIIEFSRNFGKEIATTAGLHAAHGEAAIMLVAALQHPISLIPEFVAKWQAGAEVVVGVRQANRGHNPISRFNSWLFYKIISSIAETKITPHATDYRLLDRQVIDEYNRFTEHNRITRGLIDWLGFRRDYIYFTAAPRASGRPSYSLIRLVRLAINSFVSLSLFPLKLAGYLGIIITLFSGSLGLFILIEKYGLNDPLHMSFSGPAILTVILMFLIGIVLMCLGLIALYIANIHSEVAARPLYVVRKSRI